MNSWILQIHPIYEFRSFSENGHSDDGYLRENFKKSYKGRIRKNPEIHFTYNFWDFSSKLTI